MIILEIVRTPRGVGSDAAPLEGVATLIALGAALILGTGALLCFIWRPRVFSVPLTVLAVINTAGIFIVTPMFNRQATRQDISLRVLDTDGSPLSGASVSYMRYGYGPGGRHVFDADGGPLFSGQDGIVIIPSRRMRYETRGTISKSGHRDVLFTVEMQHSKWDEERGVIVSTSKTPNIARGHIPTAEPVGLSIYLPRLSDAPLQLARRIESRSTIGQGNGAARYFNLETGKFTNDIFADLRFDLFFEMDGRHERSRLRITGLNETLVLQVPSMLSFSGNLSPYEYVFRIAPKVGYQNEIVVREPGSSPNGMIYVKARGGAFFARMTVFASGRREQEARYGVELYLNSTGSRLLE